MQTTGTKSKKITRAEWGYCLYDWANSAYATTVMAGFFPLFFKEFWSAGIDPTLTTARLGFGNSLASLAVAVLAPLLGAAADQGSAKKRFLFISTLAAIVATGCLPLAGKGQWQLALAFFLVSMTAFSAAQIFYDALLPSAATRQRYDFVSSLGFSLGYLGGGLLFAVNVLMTLRPELFGLMSSAAAVRVSFITVACWWAGFSIFLFRWVPEKGSGNSLSSLSVLTAAAWRRVAVTFREVRGLRNVFFFLLAYWFYIDGVDTVIKMAVDYGLSLGFKSTDLITALLIVQFTGFPAALLYARFGRVFGIRLALTTGIGIYCLITIWGAFMTSRSEFYLLALAIGVVQGGVQALSRSCFAHIIPNGREAEFFGFYNMLGRFAAVIGPALMAVTGLATRQILMSGAQGPEALASHSHTAARAGMLSILALFILGLYFLTKVDWKVVSESR